MGEIIFPGYTFFFASSRVHICQTSLAEIWFWPVNLDTYVEYHVDVSSEVSIRKGLHVLAIMRFVHYVLWQSQSESKYSPTYKYMNLLDAFDVVITQTGNHKVKMNGILPSSSFIYGLFSAYPN